MDKLEGTEPKREDDDLQLILEPKLGIPIFLNGTLTFGIYISDRMSSVYPEEFQRFRGLVPIVSFRFVSF